MSPDFPYFPILKITPSLSCFASLKRGVVNCKYTISLYICQVESSLNFYPGLFDPEPLNFPFVGEGQVEFASQAGSSTGRQPFGEFCCGLQLIWHNMPSRPSLKIGAKSRDSIQLLRPQRKT